MRGDALLRFRCPVCGGGFKLHDYRMIRGEITSGILICTACPYRTVIKARIPLLLQYGQEAVYRQPFERIAGPDWKIKAEKTGWDSFFSGILRENPDVSGKDRSTMLSDKQFRRAIFRGSDYYFKNFLKPVEDDQPKPDKEWQSIISEVIENAPRRLLEIGAGTGQFSEQLFKWRPGKGMYLALDIDYEMLKILEGRYRRSRSRCLFDTISADTRRIPLETNDINMVISHNGLTHVEHVELAISEIYRILSPDGTFCGIEPEGGTNFHLNIEIDGLIFHALKQNWGMHTGRNDFKNLLKKIGFESIKFEFLKTARRHAFSFKCKKPHQ